MTHHAPTFQNSSNPEHEDSMIGSAFCSSLEYLMSYGAKNSKTSSIHTWAFGYHCSPTLVPL